MRAKEFVSRFSDEHSRSAMSGLETEIVESLMDRFPEYIVYKLSQGELAIGLGTESEPRIHTKYLGEGNYAIILQEGLPNLIYRVTRALSLRGLMSSYNRSEAVSFEDVVQIMSDIFWILRETGAVFGPDYPIKDYQIATAGMLAFEAECFLVAHELGHILVYPGKDFEAQGVLERLTWGNFIGLLGSQAATLDEEFVADVLGFQIVMGVFRENVSQDMTRNQMRYAGIELVLQIYRGLERLGFTVAGTHPSADERIAHLRSYVEDTAETVQQYLAVTSLARAWEGLFDAVVGGILRPGVHEDYYDQESRLLSADLVSSLEKCAVSDIPDYLNFYLAANEVFSRGYWCYLMEKTWELLMSSMEGSAYTPSHSTGISSVEADPSKATLISYNKMKLLVGYFSRRSDPLGWLFMKKCQDYLLSTKEASSKDKI